MSIGRLLASALAALALSSCQIVDNFSGRAVGFNVEAEQAQQQALLLNIVRASLNRPMQFTTLSSITGTASETGNTTLSIPFGPDSHRPKTAAGPNVFGMSGTISGGPTFTVPVLDTQEFYQGELKPLTGQEYRFFLDEGISPAVLFYIFVEHIEFTVAGAKPVEQFEFHSYVGDDFDVDEFAAVADYLLSMGLTIEQVHRAQPIGPEMTAAQLANLRDLAQATSAGLHISPVRPGGDKSAEPKKTDKVDAAAPKKKPDAAKHVAEKPSGRYQVEKQMSTYRPCFNPPTDQRGMMADSLMCGSTDLSDFETETTGNLTRSGGFRAPELAARLSRIRDAYLKTVSPEVAAKVRQMPVLPGDQNLEVKLYMRSTEGILHHLGSIAAEYLYKEGAARRVFQVKIADSFIYLPYPMMPPCPKTADPTAHDPIAPGFHCESMFVLTNQRPDDSPLSVDYDSKTYYVASEKHVGTRTMRLLDLVKQLLALHTSAKELPASNVLNVIGGPSP